MPLLFPCPAPGTALSFFSCYLIVPKRVTNAAFAAAECLCHFRLICVRMFIHIHFQFFWIDLSEIPMQLILFQITPFFQPLFPFPYGRYRYFEYLMCFFQCMPCLPISYCPFPVFSRITHAFILSLLLLVFNRDYYIAIAPGTAGGAGDVPEMPDPPEIGEPEEPAGTIPIEGPCLAGM